MLDSLQQAVDDVKEKLDLKVSRVKVYNRESMDKELSRHMPYHLPIVMIVPRMFSERSGDSYVIHTDYDTTRFYKTDELRGFVVSILSACKAFENLYTDTIASGMSDFEKYFVSPDAAGLLSAFNIRLMDSTSYQIGIQHGFSEELFSYLSRSAKELKRFLHNCGPDYIKALDLRYQGSLENQVGHLIGSTQSPAFHASGNTGHAAELDALTADIASSMSLDKRVVSRSEQLRKSLTVKNPPTSQTVEDSFNNLMKLYASL